MDKPARYGLATAEAVEGLSGIEVLRAMIAGDLPGPPMAQVMGFTLTEVEPGRVVFTGTPGPHLYNPLGSVHGGYALTLIDSAAGCALHTMLAAGIGYTSIETKANFTRPVPPSGTVACEGRLVSHGRQIATAEAYLRDEKGKLLAHGTSTLIILRPR